MALRILIAEDHPLVVCGVRDALSVADDMEVVADAGTGPQALSLISRTNPDIVLMDIRLPGLDGFSCLERIRSDHPTVKVIICSASSEPDQIAAAFRLGATAYIVKSVKPVDLPSAIRQAHEQSVYQAFGVTPKNGDTESLDLTEREQTILGCMARGLSNKAIGGELWVTEQTVKFHLTNIYRKLGVSNRTGAARVAREHGLVASHE
jgi:DNA-binding NarL/FixJ family response regulator